MAWQGYAAAGSGYSYMAASSTSVTKKTTQAQNHLKTREQHMAKVEIWLCKICNKDFGTKSGLNRHFTMVHEQPKPQPVKEVSKAMVPVVNRGNTLSIVCRICGSHFASQSNLTRHLNTVHQKTLPKPGNTNIAMSNSTKMVQKNKTNVTINMYNPVFYNNCTKK